MKVDQWKIGYMRNLLEGKVNHGYEVSLLRTKINSIIGELEKLQEYDIDVPDDKLAAMFASVNDKITSMKEESSNIKRRPSIIVMKYLQEFGYKVIPVNPYSKERNIYGETVVGNLEDITMPVDIVDVFRPSKETPSIAKQAVKIGAKVLWLQYGIDSLEAQKIADKIADNIGAVAIMTKVFATLVF